MMGPRVSYLIRSPWMMVASRIPPGYEPEVIAQVIFSGVLNRAFSQGKPIFTFRAEDIKPAKALEFYLARHQWTDGFPPPVEKRIAHMARALLELDGRPARPAPLKKDQSIISTSPEAGSGVHVKLFCDNCGKPVNATAAQVLERNKVLRCEDLEENLVVDFPCPRCAAFGNQKQLVVVEVAAGRIIQ